MYLKSRNYRLFLQTQPDFALKSLGIHKGFLRLFALNPACVCEISVIFFVFRYTLGGRSEELGVREQCRAFGYLQKALKAGLTIPKAIPHNSKCRYGERGAAAARPKAQIILDAAKVSAASGGNSEPKQGQRSQSARGFCPRSTMRVPQPDIIEHFGNADAVPQPPKRCLSRKAGIVRCCLRLFVQHC